MKPAKPLPRLPAISVEAFRRGHMDRQRPAVLTGVTDDWGAQGRWTIDYLREHHAAIPVSVARVEGANVVVDPRRGLVHDQRKLGEFLDDLRGGPGAGYLMTRLEALPPDLRGDVRIPPHFASAPWLVTKMWLSAPGLVSLLHRDLADNLNVTIHGLKRFMLFSPDDDDLLYPHGLLSSLPNAARVDPESPDLARYPRLRDAQPLVVDLGPGEGIYIPRRWWHHVRTLRPTISMNFFWASGPWLGVVVAADLFKRARGLSR